jgi:LacI family transcriptional regulator
LPVSLDDVARRIAVSRATVSRVVSGSSYPVSDDLRRRVQQAVHDLGYRPNALARALAKQQSRTIGVIVGDVTDPYFAEIGRGVEDYARPRGYLTMICNADRNLSAEISYLELLRQHQAAGIVFAGGMFTNAPEADALNRLVTEALDEGVRIVALGDRGSERVPVIAVDERMVLYDLTTYLVGLGHHRIGFVLGPAGLTTSELRLQGFLDAMSAARLDPSRIFTGGFGLDAGRAAATRMLGSTLPDAVIAATDETAVGVLVSLREAGVDIPGQVSVAGVDGSRYAEIMDMTTVKVPMHALGAMAARQLLDWESSPCPDRVTLPHRIVARGSTARPGAPDR